MPRGYTVAIDNKNIADANYFLRLLGHTNKSWELTEVDVNQVEGVVDAQLRLLFDRLTADVTGGSAVTPRPLDPGDSAAGLAAKEGTFSAQGTAGDRVRSPAFNSRQGLLWVPTGQNKIWSPGGGMWAAKFAATPPTGADLFSFTFTFVEYG